MNIVALAWSFEANLISKIQSIIVLIANSSNKSPSHSVPLALDVIRLLPERASLTLPRISSALVDNRFVNN